MMGIGSILVVIVMMHEIMFLSHGTDSLALFQRIVLYHEKEKVLWGRPS